MRESYKKAMNDISLSEEMKKSILENTLKAANNKKKSSKIVYMKRFATMAACLVVCLFSYHVASEYGKVSYEGAETDLSSAPPLVSEISEAVADADNSEANVAQKNDNADNSKANIDLSAPNLEKEIQDNELEQGINLGAVQSVNPIQNGLNKERIEAELGYSVETPSYIPDGYQQSDMALIGDNLVQVTYENESDTICYRMAKGSEDISGDFNTYDKVETVKINDIDVTLKGDDLVYYNAAWMKSGSAFSLSSDEGLAKETMIKIVENVK